MKEPKRQLHQAELKEQNGQKIIPKCTMEDMKQTGTLKRYVELKITRIKLLINNSNN